LQEGKLEEEDKQYFWWFKKNAFQISSEVLKLPGPLEFQLEPLPDGLNFMSDAFFVDIKHGEEVKNLFVKASCIAE
jgi:hypothetical protein